MYHSDHGDACAKEHHSPSDSRQTGPSGGKQESRVNTPDEESITNALVKVTKDRERTVYVTAGHGERSLSDTDRNGLTVLKASLEKQHYTVKPLVLSQGMPQDATVVVIAGPQKSFLEAEIRMIQEYLQKGGHMLYLQDPETDPGLGSVLAAYGVGLATLFGQVFADAKPQIAVGGLVPSH